MPEENGRQPNGHEENGHDGNGGHPSEQEAEVEYQLLGGIGIVSFTASPSPVVPFERTTLSWSVNIPPALHGVRLTVAGQTSAGASGSAIDTLYSTTVYSLTAETAIVNREIARLTVPVDDSSCKFGSIEGRVISSQLKTVIAQQFQGGSGFSLGGAGVSVNLSDNTIAINIPLNLNVPDWFDATMSIAVQIEVEMQGVPPQAAVWVQVTNVGIDVSWSWYGTLLSLGVTSAVAAGMEKIAQVFMSEIAKSQIAPRIAEQISNLVQGLAIDPGGRTFALTSLTLTSGYLTYTVCPLPSASSHQAHQPVEAPTNDEH
jgi:hypothetical protein